MTYSDPFGPPTPNAHPIDPYRVRGDGGVGSSDEYCSQQESWSDMTQNYTKKFLHSPFGIAVLVPSTLLVIIGIYSAITNLTDNSKIIQQNVIGNEKPETYILKDGVKYYSHIDGKDISDLLKK